MIKMLVLDIDGTIYRKDFTASQRVKSTLQKLIKNGIKVLIATGRMYSASISVAQDIGLVEPIICYQGGYIREIGGKEEVLLKKTVPLSLAREVLKILKVKNIHANVYIDDVLVVEDDNETIKKYTDERHVPYRVVESFNYCDLGSINKILAIDSEPEKIEQLQKELSVIYSDDLYIVRSMPIFCEISNRQATKGTAINYLANKWGIKKEEIMAIGDQDNDIEMLAAAGIGVAMGNATDELKKIADYITETVDNDGVACAVEKFMKESL